MIYGSNDRRRRTYVLRKPDDPGISSDTTITLNNTRARDVLETLIGAGASGSTFYDNPTSCLAAHVYNLRKLGFEISTDLRPHRGEYPGCNARYTLLSNVTRTQADMKRPGPCKTARWVASGQPSVLTLPTSNDVAVSGYNVGGMSDG